LLPEGMMFPFWLRIHSVHVIGIIMAEQIQDGKRETSDRLLGVAVHSYDHENLQTINDVS